MKQTKNTGFLLTLGVLFFAFGFARADAPPFAKGADVGWLSEMESTGVKFFDAKGNPKDCLEILKEQGINSIRLRVWVNPANNWCGKDDVVAMAKRAAGMGFRIMIDFHYSDSWADPGKQVKPAAWAGHDFNQLLDDVTQHTTDVLGALKAAGVTPEWVQVGNEIRPGMLLPDGSIKNWPQLTQLLNKGYDAVKAVDPDTKVVIHVDNGFDNSLFRWWFDNATKNGVKFDVIGMSLYPKTPEDVPQITDECLANMNDMVARYGKDVILSEIGLDRNAAQASHDMLVKMIKGTESVTGGKGLGIFYWEPESSNWNHYNKGAWNDDGKPTIAMDAFLDADK
jgi:arabinogalactan endo-1,4-beta-galactosidase